MEVVRLFTAKVKVESGCTGTPSFLWGRAHTKVSKAGQVTALKSPASPRCSILKALWPLRLGQWQ